MESAGRKLRFEPIPQGRAQRKLVPSRALEEVLFSFRSYPCRVGGKVTVENVTTGKRLEASGEFSTEAFTTYIIRWHEAD